MTEFEPKTRGGYEYVILERDGPDGRMYGRYYKSGVWYGCKWESEGFHCAIRSFDLIPRITVSDAVMAEARRQFDIGHYTDDRQRAAIASILSIARQEWEVGR